jgi:hypothetical protein
MVTLVDEFRPTLLKLGAQDIPHGRVNLLVHLTGVGVLLTEWGLKDEVIRAGLFHAAYGSESYPGLCLPVSRTSLTEIIGKRPEQLVYWYCAATPASVEHSIRFGNSLWLWNRFEEIPITVQESDFRDLLWLYFANIVEQDGRVLAEDGILPQEAAQYAPVWEKLAAYLGDDAMDVWRRVYSTTRVNDR